MMNKLTLIACICLAQIRHNGKPYGVGDMVELSEHDKFFLQKSGFVKVATTDEIAKFASQTNANSNSHLDKADEADENGDDKSELNSPLSAPPSDSNTPPTPSKPLPVPASSVTPSREYGKLTKAELITQLSARGITHSPKAKNDELVALLVADDNKAIPLEIEDEE